MAKFIAIFNLLTVIFVSYGPFVNGEETTLQERKDALSTLFGELDKYVPDSNKIQTSFDECCSRHMNDGTFSQNKLMDCTYENFTSYKRALQANGQSFAGPNGSEKRQELKSALEAYQLALRNEAENKTTQDVNYLLLDEVKNWIQELNTENPVFHLEVQYLEAE